MAKNKTNTKIKTPLKKILKRDKYLLMMVAPCVLYFLIFHYLPMVWNVVAFQDYSIRKGIFGSEWIGLDNFIRFFKSHYAIRVIRNTFMLSFMYLMIQAFGGTTINFFSEAKWFRWLYVLSNVWQNFGWDSIIYFAAIAGVNPELYEAARVDGAGRWKKMLYVTLPCISPTIIVLLIMRIGWLLSVGFEKIILMYNESTYETADVISTYVYRVGLLNSDFSYGTAIGLFNCLVSLILILLANGLSRKYSETSLF